ncbi:MAG TPA: hypothetical protein VMW89_20675 [Desulfatiglandales bacterium]|nr:hypothetical protein [Desulfatiglandales bacterium]
MGNRQKDEKSCLVDTTVQEKNITFPTDTKPYSPVIERGVGITSKGRIALKRTFDRATKKLMVAQRFRTHPKNCKRAFAAQRKLTRIAGRLLTELERKLPPASWLFGFHFLACKSQLNKSIFIAIVI